MAQIEKYFNDNFIPFFKNSSINFVLIPYQTIDSVFNVIDNLNILKHSSQKDKFFARIQNQINFMSSSHKIYVVLNEYSKYLSSEYLDNFFGDDIKKVIFVNNIHEAKLGYEYYVENSCVIRSFGSLQNVDYDRIKNKLSGKIYAPKVVYLKAIVMMTQEEIQRVNELKIIISDDKKDIEIRLTNKPKSDHISEIKINSYSIKNSAPIAHIDGITRVCINCNKIMFLPNSCHSCTSIKV